MDVEFQKYNWNPSSMEMTDQQHLIDDLFFGSFDTPSSEWTDKGLSPDKPEKTRTRRVTITEITDEDNSDDWTLINDEKDASTEEEEEEAINMKTEEIFHLLDDVVQDWKIKLECVVGDGLKKLRKASKEKKMKIKYLPGEGSTNKKLVPAKTMELKDWQADFRQILTTLQVKLDKLGNEKIDEVDTLFMDKILQGSNKNFEKINKNKKQMINIDCREGEQKKSGGYHGLKQLIRELDNMCNAVSKANSMINDNCVPIYNMYNNNAKKNVVATPYEFPLNKYLKHLLANQANPNLNNDLSAKFDAEAFAKNQANIMDSLDDFKIRQSKQQKVVKAKLKEGRRDTNVVNAQRKMLERRNKRGADDGNTAGFSFKMKHYKKNGKDHYLIVKKPKQAKVEAEDIFEDWRSANLDTMEDRKRRITPRTRKLSHRAQRKEMLREEVSSPVEGPMLYSDILKKNMKFRPNQCPIEDIFEAWRDYLQELDELLSDDGMTIQTAKQERLLQTSESAQETCQKEIQECGQPTVKTACETKPPKVNRAVKSVTVAVSDCVPKQLRKQAHSIKQKAIKKRRPRKYERESIFAAWRHNFSDDTGFYPQYRAKMIPKSTQYETEEYFRVWRRNLHVKQVIVPDRKKRQNQPKMMPENIFYDWLHNFHSKPHHFHHHHRHSKKEKAVERKQEEASENPQGEEPQDVTAKPIRNKSRNNNQRRSKKKGNMKFEP